MVELKHLQKVIGQNTAVEIEPLAVNAGEVAVIVGPVGSGGLASAERLSRRVTTLPARAEYSINRAYSDKFRPGLISH